MTEGEPATRAADSTIVAYTTDDDRYPAVRLAHRVFLPDTLESISELDDRGITIERVRSGIPSR